MYKGQWANGKKNGNGTLYGEDGSKLLYEGEWVDDKQNGYGVYYTNGTVYRGQWANGKKNGNGTLYGEDGSKLLYEGEWVDDKQNGYGVYYTNGTVYRGQWANGMRNGNGKLFDKNGTKISEGVWTDDKLMTKNLNQLVDNKKKGKDHFFGISDHIFQFSPTPSQHNSDTILYSNGDKYIGPLENGTRNGYGQYYYKNGQIYNGWFKNGDFWGHGILYNKNNQIKYEGEWKNGKVFIFYYIKFIFIVFDLLWNNSQMEKLLITWRTRTNMLVK